MDQSKGKEGGNRRQNQTDLSHKISRQQKSCTASHFSNLATSSSHLTSTHTNHQTFRTHNSLSMSTTKPNHDITKTNHETIIPDNARAVCGKELPSLQPQHEHDGTGSILLFYQYVEDPVWTKAEHKTALKKVIELGNKFRITGRGRVAQEGLNCTLTGKPNDIRSFCYALREWNDIFNETDFKITDGVAMDKLFKSLSIRKANELVAYGLAGGEYIFICKYGCWLLMSSRHGMRMRMKKSISDTWNEDTRAAVRQPLSRMSTSVERGASGNCRSQMQFSQVIR